MKSSNLKFETRSNQKKYVFSFLFIFWKYESAFTFLIDLPLEARADFLQIFQLLFWVD